MKIKFISRLQYFSCDQELKLILKENISFFFLPNQQKQKQEQQRKEKSYHSDFAINNTLKPFSTIASFRFLSLRMKAKTLNWKQKKVRINYRKIWNFFPLSKRAPNKITYFAYEHIALVCVRVHG